MKYKIATAALALMSSVPAFAQEEPAGPITVSGSVALVSDYRFRGVSQTDKGMAVQGGITATHESGGQKMLIACGQLADYRCTWGLIEEDADGAISLDVESVQRIGLEIGDRFTMAGRA